MPRSAGIRVALLSTLTLVGAVCVTSPFGASAADPGANGLLLFDYAGVGYPPGHGPPAGTPRRGLYVISSDGGGLRLVRASGSSIGAAWSGDGRRIIFGDSRTGGRSTLETVNATGRGLRHIRLPAVRRMSGPNAPAWAADSKRIAFVRYGPGIEPSTALFVANADGSRQRRIFDAPKNDLIRRPRWSPDGRRLAFAQLTDGISVINRDGSGRRLIARTIPRKTGTWGPDWSPDGKRLVFGLGALRGAEDGGTIEVVNADGSGLTPIVRLQAPDHLNYLGFAWSPDGKQIAYIAYSGGKNRLWIVNVDGTNAHSIHTFPNRQGPFVISLDWQRRL